MAKKWKNKKTGIWYVRYKDNQGDWKTKYAGRKTAAEVEVLRKKYDSLEYIRAHELNTPIKGLGIDDIFSEFTKMVLLDPVLSAGSHRNYTKSMKVIIDWCHSYNIKKMDDITPAFVDTYKQYTIVNRDLKKTTARHCQKLFVRFLNWAIKNNYYNDYKLVLNIDRIPKGKRGRPRYYTTAELQKIFKYPEYTAAFQFLFYTGLRVSELCNLKWADIRIDSNTLELSNTKSLSDGIDTIPLNSKALRVLSGIPRISDHIFTTTAGAPITQSVLWAALKKILTAENIPDGTIHTFRHSFASHLSIRGYSIHKIKELLRHTDINVTMIYAHLNAQSIADASEGIPDITADKGGPDETAPDSPPDDETDRGGAPMAA